MKARNNILILLLLFVSFNRLGAGEKVVKSAEMKKVARTDKSDQSDQSQIQVRFTLPTLPENVHITHALLVFDQTFGADADGKPLPRGLVNKTSDDIQLSVFSVSGGATGYGKWLDVSSTTTRRLTDEPLLPNDVIQSAKSNGRWKDEAIRFDVTEYVRNEMKIGISDLFFAVGGDANNLRALESAKVEANLENISVQLVIYYFEQPVFPQHMRKN